MENMTMTIPCTLPEQTTTFIGRADELAEIGSLLTNAACRLLSHVEFSDVDPK